MQNIHTKSWRPHEAVDVSSISLALSDQASRQTSTLATPPSDSRWHPDDIAGDKTARTSGHSFLLSFKDGISTKLASQKGQSAWTRWANIAIDGFIALLTLALLVWMCLIATIHGLNMDEQFSSHQSALSVVSSVLVHSVDFLL